MDPGWQSLFFTLSFIEHSLVGLAPEFTSHCPSVLWQSVWWSYDDMTRKIVPEMIYNVPSGTLTLLHLTIFSKNVRYLGLLCLKLCSKLEWPCLCLTETSEAGIQQLHCSISTWLWSWSYLRCLASWKASLSFTAWWWNARRTASTFSRTWLYAKHRHTTQWWRPHLSEIDAYFELWFKWRWLQGWNSSWKVLWGETNIFQAVKVLKDDHSPGKLRKLLRIVLEVTRL